MDIKCRRCGNPIPQDSLNKDVLCVSHYNIDEYAFFCKDCSPMIMKAIDTVITDKAKEEKSCSICKHYRKCDFSDDIMCHLDKYGHDLCLDNDYERFEARTCVDCANFVSYGSDSLCNALRLGIDDMNKPKCDVTCGWRPIVRFYNVYNDFNGERR